MPKSSSYIISYDIEDDHERLRVSKVLEGFGQRVQKSVFECPLSRGKKHELEKRLEKLELDTGFVLIYRIDEKAKRTAIGQVPGNIAASDAHAFII
ncbi:CRISPR-associated endonuclease Cas2 [Candidatus Parcubacteria bacterium]|nr:MAG: CRISPR-associated endonuclease Cas2 [Candidatus Parcubacteria bacterium]